jgi:hypothetical protein
MSVGAINSLLSGYPVSPVTRWGAAEAQIPLEPTQIPLKPAFAYETVSRAEHREYPRPQKSRLSEREQEELRDYINLQLALLLSVLKV